MKLNRFLLLVIIVHASCSGVRVLDTDAEAGFQLSQYKTFDFYKLEGSGDTTANFIHNADLIKQAITEELQAKGLTQNSADPDLLVNIGVVVQEKVQTRETNFRDAPRYVGQRRYHWKSEEVEVGRYKEGTVTVHLVEPAGNRMVWKGVVEGTVPRKEEKLRSTIDEGIKALFQNL